MKAYHSSGCCACLDGARPSNSIIVTDLMGSKFDPCYIMSLEASSAYFASNSGRRWFLPQRPALGTQWASPENPVVCITTDQSLLQCPQALWTAAHYNLNVKFIIVNSRGSNSLTSEFEHYVSSPGDCTHPISPGQTMKSNIRFCRNPCASWPQK